MQPLNDHLRHRYCRSFDPVFFILNSALRRNSFLHFKSSLTQKLPPLQQELPPGHKGMKPQ